MMWADYAAVLIKPETINPVSVSIQSNRFIRAVCNLHGVYGVDKIIEIVNIANSFIENSIFF